MAQFFITRPVLAWVISIFIVIAGLISLPSIPVAQYPQVAWPQITISTSYTGAAPGEINQSVSQPIEDELNAKLAEAERSISATKTQAMSHVTEIATAAAADIVAQLTGKPADPQRIASAIAAAKA